MKKLLSLLLCAIIATSASSLYAASTPIQLEEETIIQTPETPYEYQDYAAQIEEETDFKNDSILVAIKPEESEINQVFTAKDFPELDVESVEDLTYFKENVYVYRGNANCSFNGAVSSVMNMAYYMYT